MAITPTATRLGTYSVRYDWTGTGPYDVWLNGQRVLTSTTAETYTAQTTDGTTNPLPAIEVLEAGDAAESDTYSPLLRMQWRGQSGASLYLVQQYVDSEWTTIGAVRENGTGYYAYTTTALTDGDTEQFRVRAQDSRGYQSEPVTFTHTVVCNPAPPVVSYTYDDNTGDLTVDAG
jgi:hypothetical protein